MADHPETIEGWLSLYDAHRKAASAADAAWSVDEHDLFEKRRALAARLGDGEGNLEALRRLGRGELGAAFSADASRPETQPDDAAFDTGRAEELLYGRESGLSPAELNAARASNVDNYLHIRKRSLALVNADAPAGDIYAVRAAEADMARRVMDAPVSLAMLGERAPQYARLIFRQDPAESRIISADDARNARDLATSWMNLDADVRRAADAGRFGEAAELRDARVALTGRMMEEPLSFVVVGHESAQRAKGAGAKNSAVGKLQSDVLDDEAFVGRARSKREEESYKSFKSVMGTTLGVDANDAVARYAKVQKEIWSREVSGGKDALQLTNLRRLSRELAGEIDKSPTDRARLMREQADLQGVFARDIRDPKKVAREAAAREAVDGAERAAANDRGLSPGERARLGAAEETALGRREHAHERAKAGAQEGAKAGGQEGARASGRFRDGFPEAGPLEREVYLNTPRRIRVSASPSPNRGLPHPTLQDHLEDKSVKLLGVNLGDLASPRNDAAIDRELQKLAASDPQRLRKIYEGNVRMVRAMQASQEVTNEMGRVAHDRVEMGRRAIGDALVAKGQMTREEADRDYTALMSRTGKSLPKEKARDAFNPAPPRKTVLQDWAQTSAQAAFAQRRGRYLRHGKYILDHARDAMH